MFRVIYSCIYYSELDVLFKRYPVSNQVKYCLFLTLSNSFFMGMEGRYWQINWVLAFFCFKVSLLHWSLKIWLRSVKEPVDVMDNIED